MDLMLYWVFPAINKTFYHIKFNTNNKFVWLFNRLTRYLYPTDQQLRTLAGVPKEKPKKGKHTENGKIGDIFHVPRNLDVTLDNIKITMSDVLHLKYYTEYQWLLDFSVYATAVYAMTEVCQSLFLTDTIIFLSSVYIHFCITL